MSAVWLDPRHDADAVYGQIPASVWQASERVLQQAVHAATSDEFLRQSMADLAGELTAAWVALVRRDPDWQVVCEFGRRELQQLPVSTLAEVLDREAAVWSPIDDDPSGSMLAVPVGTSGEFSDVLLMVGRNLSSETLGRAVALSHTLGIGLIHRDKTDRLMRRLDLMNDTLQIVSGLGVADDTQSLLELIAAGATQLLHCDRASIFIWDRERHQVIACPALGIQGETLRLPDDTGIVGQVIRSGESIQVDDAYNDARFDPSVDQRTGYQTQTILCVPMRNDDDVLIGAFQTLNKKEGRFSTEDRDCLIQLGRQASIVLKSTQEREALLRSHQQLTQQATQAVQLIGESPAIVALRKTLQRLAETDLPVLVLGESGTGKEVVAHALHYHGPRAEHPFIAVNCAALTETLLESELFGYEKGAFTDARETRQGKFEIADGGTVFLDEIGDMSQAGQAKLLRVLEEKIITRVGGPQTIPINVRVIAATNTNLAKSVAEKRFREDLYYRLNVVTLELPPLRDRPEDVILLARHFLGGFRVQARRPKLELSEDAERRLRAYTWPGNVRELRNLMERLAFLASADRIEAEDVGFLLTPERTDDVTLSAATRRFQQEYIRRSIKRAGTNMSEAAKLLGLHRANLYRKMKQLGMTVELGPDIDASP